MNTNRSNSPIRIRSFVRQNSHSNDRDPERADSIVEKVIELREELEDKNHILENEYDKIYNLTAELSGKK